MVEVYRQNFKNTVFFVIQDVTAPEETYVLSFLTLLDGQFLLLASFKAML